MTWPPIRLVADGDVCRSTQTPQCPHPWIKRGKECISTRGPGCRDPNTRFGNGQCVSTATPICRQPYKWNGQKCVSEDSPYCDPPGTWDGQACVLPKDPACTGTNIVPVPVNGSCISNARPICQPPSREFNGNCIVNQKLQCTEGIFNGQDCVLDNKPQCPIRTQPSGDKCIATRNSICPTGYHWVGGQCVSTEIDPCGNGFREVNGQCVSEVEPHCPPPSLLDGGKCIGGKPVCKEGTFDNGDGVSDKIPDCGPGRDFKNGVCVEIHTPTCKEPFVLDPVKNVCVDSTGPRCPTGQVHHNGSCVLVPDQECLEYEWCPSIPIIANSLKASA